MRNIVFTPTGWADVDKLEKENKRLYQKHRLIYTFNDGEVIVIGCYGHYDD